MGKHEKIQAEKKQDEKTQKVKMKPAVKAVSIILVCLIAIAGIAFGILMYLNPSQVYSVFKSEEVYRNIKVEDVNLNGLTYAQAKRKLEAYEEKLRDEYKIEVVCDGNSIMITKNALKIDFNTDEVLSKIPSLKGGESLELTSTVSLNELSAQKLLTEFAKTLYVAPINANVTSFDYDTLKFTVSAETNGKRLLINTAKDKIMEYLKENKTGKVELETLPLLAEMPKDKLIASLGELGTGYTYCTNNANSEHNMRLAMQKMDKTMVEAGGTYSFHEAVGDSTTAEGGWVHSGAYRDGKLQQEYGGGICQAATTLYHAGLYSNMEVVERWYHLQPSDYCTVGLDATVDYPYVDCKLKNNTAYPIYIVSKMEGKELTLKMYGFKDDSYDKIKLEGWYTDFTPKPDPEFKTDNSLKEGEYVRERSGYSGSKAEAKRIWLDKEGNVIKEEALPKSTYSAVSPIFKVGPNTDTSKIPLDSEGGIIEPEPEEKPEETPEGENSSEPAPESSETATQSE